MFSNLQTAFQAASLVSLVVVSIGCERPSVDRDHAKPTVVLQSKNATSTTSEPRPEKREILGDSQAGRDVFRFETFGNEGFWTDAMQLPKGVEAAKFTPIDALKAGLHVDVDAIEPEMKKSLAAELKTDMSPQEAPMLNDVKTTLALIQANAVIGVVPKGEKIGISCTICHAVTDKSVFDMPGGGSIGRRIDGPAASTLDMGGLLALAANSRAYYPNLQLELGGDTIGRAPEGLRADSTEEEVDAYLKNTDFYPRGTFDETQDGIGNPVQNTPLFRQDLAAPFGSNGLHETFEGISNASYTTNLDPTNLATPEGLTLLTTLAGENGKQLHIDYVQVLEETGVTGYPFVDSAAGHPAGHRDTPVGRQVDEQKILDMKAYTFELGVPQSRKAPVANVKRGRELFESNCTQCHVADQGKPVSEKLVGLEKIWPAYKPAMIAQRKSPLGPIENSPGGYDDKMVILDASERGEIRGVALPLLLDLARKSAFLHDNSVASLHALLDSARGPDEPHPFYINDAKDRAELVAFLEGLGTGE